MIDFRIERNSGHPGDQRPGFDHLRVRADSIDELNQYIASAKRKFWHLWKRGWSRPQRKPAAILYKPCGQCYPWRDTDQKPHPGNDVRGRALRPTGDQPAGRDAPSRWASSPPPRAPRRKLALPPDFESGPNCGLVAMAVAAQCSLEEAITAYQKAHVDLKGRLKSGNWKGGTHRDVRRKALTKYLGVRFETVSIKLSTKMTLERFVRSMAIPGRTYIVTTTRHVQCVLSGMVSDQRGVVPMPEYWGRRKQIREVLLVLDE